MALALVLVGMAVIYADRHLTWRTHLSPMGPRSTFEEGSRHSIHYFSIEPQRAGRYTNFKVYWYVDTGLQEPIASKKSYSVDYYPRLQTLVINCTDYRGREFWKQQWTNVTPEAIAAVEEDNGLISDLKKYGCKQI